MTCPAEGTPESDPAWARQLLGHLRPAGRDTGKVVAWLAGTVRGTVALTDASGRLLAGEPVPVDDALTDDLVRGRIASAAWDGRGRHVRLVRVDLPATPGVLTVARIAPFDREAADAVTHTAAVLEVLLRARGSTETEDRLRRAAADLRLAILQLLMVEDTVSARRVAAGLWPGLLDTDTACVYVVEGRAEDRDTLADECLAATGGQALVVRCPAVEAHVIVVAPDERAGPALRELVEPRPYTYLGGSTRQSLARTAGAYGQAVSALAVARFRPGKAAVYAERSHPERLMDPAALAAWADRLLRPLAGLPHHTGGELLATTRLGLEFTAVNAAKVLGVSRNTVRARMTRTEALLGADFTDLAARAAVHLALNTRACPPEEPAPAGDEAPTGTAGLTALLAGPAVQVWARDLLARLNADSRDLRGTLRAWIAAGANAERAAQRLGVHAQTVREHVRAAEPVLERQLLCGGGDLYEVVLAHLAVGDLAPPALGPEEPGDRDRPVHR
ncbi:helix-turn-helix domain-containing protein [Streptomyces sp. XM83C]|uniref:PucR family transcriptional regulator n=1 Tax=Streptomyces sp. XM83C TaxID=2929781 RepID=UPI001FFBCBE4|nr:helix-turn-helix domain-containing protein [Streptomyces sp. XM83C]MCK1820702.1 helix-turn-helix domain-containing protein [Streptomyces sp. XM83C]